MKYAIRFSVFFTIVYTLVDLVNWKVVYETIDIFFILKILFLFILSGVTAYFVLTPKNNKQKKKNTVEETGMDKNV